MPFDNRISAVPKILSVQFYVRRSSEFSGSRWGGLPRQTRQPGWRPATRITPAVVSSAAKNHVYSCQSTVPFHLKKPDGFPSGFERVNKVDTPK